MTFADYKALGTLRVHNARSKKYAELKQITEITDAQLKEAEVMEGITEEVRTAVKGQILIDARRNAMPIVGKIRNIYANNDHRGYVTRL